MPLRTRAGSSPIRGSALQNGLSEAAEGPSVMVTSPSRPPDSRLRRGSLGAAVETVKQRNRGDTITSSEMSSDNELDSMTFQKRKVHPRRPSKSNLLSQRISEDDKERLDPLDEGNESDSTLSSEFSGTADSGSLLGHGDDPLDSSPPTELTNIPAMTSFNNASPKKNKLHPTPTLQALPPPRPISVVPPVSTLTQMLQAKNHKPSNPLQRFASWDAASEAQSNPIYIRLYCPFSSKPSKPIELLIRKFNDKGEAVTVAEAIGYALWRYQEEKVEPPLEPDRTNVNCWVLRMYDDGEIDDEFPALTRNRPLMDFASNNSRGMRPRAREKPWDEFGLVKASERELAENEKITPLYSREAAAAAASQKAVDEGIPALAPPQKPMPSRAKSFRNPITGPSFAPTATRKNPSNLADAPTISSVQSASRTGAPKTLIVHFTDENFNTKRVPIPCTTDTYIDEIFDKVCRDLQLDKGLYVLKVSGSTTVAPPDRTVEALGTRMDLDLVRRRFIGDGVFGIAGSPGSSSPNAPLMIATGGATKKTKKGDRTANAAIGTALVHPLAKHTGSDNILALTQTSSYYKRWPVLRKQPMSFASSTSRILAIDHEYVHIMPGDTGTTKQLFDQPGKTTTIHFSSVIGSKVSKKHPRMFRLIVYKEKETKRYDFEAQSHEDALAIVREVKKGTDRSHEGPV